MKDILNIFHKDWFLDLMIITFENAASHKYVVQKAKTWVTNLGYMYLHGCVCLSEGVHLRLAIEEKNIHTYYLFPNTYTHVIE